jgi:hypothetical protein
MKIVPLLKTRLANQQISGTAFTKPEEVVQWLGAMQAQDFGMAKCGLDNKTFARCHGVLAKALEGGKFCTREELAAALQDAKINAEGLTLTNIMMHAELEGVLCSGPRQGKQFTYALLEERVPPARKLGAGEAMATLATRYFTSRGPATVHDFANWASLQLADAREAVDMVKSLLVKEIINGQEYWAAEALQYAGLQTAKKLSATFLMPNYDEYAMGYKHRDDLFGPVAKTGNARLDNPVFNHTVMVGGIVAGSWKKVSKGKTVAVDTTFEKPLTAAQQNAVQKAVKRYLAFAGSGRD